MNKEHEFITGKKKKGEEEKIDRIKPERHYLPLRPAERKNEKKKKKERKKERKAHLLAAPHLLTYDYHRHLLGESFSRPDIDLTGSLLTTIHFLLICGSRDISHRAIRHRSTSCELGL